MESPEKKDQQETTSGGAVVRRYSESEWLRTRMGIPDEAVLGFRKRRDEVYKRRFGEAALVSHEVLTTLIPHIDVMEYHRSDKDEDVCVLVTSGMSDLAMNAPAKAEVRRVELILYCREPKQEYINTLRFLAHFPHDQKTWLGAFHTLPNGNPPATMWGSPVLDTILLLPALVRRDADLHEDLVFDGEGVHFLWVVPITSAECNLKLTEGSNSLLDLLEQNCHPYIFDPSRKSYV